MGVMHGRDGLRLHSRRSFRHEQIQEPVLGVFLRFLGDFFPLRVSDHIDGDLHEIAHHGLHVFADVADFRVFRRLHLYERGIGETGKAPGNLRLPHARGSDHQNILRVDLVAQLGADVLATPAVSQRDGHRALGIVLPDDVSVELTHDFGGG
jgi:hypothetical protein